jgi:Resolvase, N terminal domain
VYGKPLRKRAIATTENTRFLTPDFAYLKTVGTTVWHLKGGATAMRAAVYLRVSTQDQTTANQERELRAVAQRMGADVTIYRDHGISGAKGRDKRPEFDRMLKDATRRKVDIVMADRRGVR